MWYNNRVSGYYTIKAKCYGIIAHSRRCKIVKLSHAFFKRRLITAIYSNYTIYIPFCHAFITDYQIKESFSAVQYYSAAYRSAHGRGRAAARSHFYACFAALSR